MTLGHWEYFFDFGASTSTSTGAPTVFLNRRLTGAGLVIHAITDVRL